MPAPSLRPLHKPELPALGREFLLYAAASAVALAVDAALFTFGLRRGLSVPASATLGFMAGLALVYAASTLLIFRQHALRDRRVEFILFAMIGTIGLALTQFLLWLTMSVVNMAPVPAKLVTATAVFLTNFLLRKGLLFSRSFGASPD